MSCLRTASDTQELLIRFVGGSLAATTSVWTGAVSDEIFDIHKFNGPRDKEKFFMNGR